MKILIITKKIWNKDNYKKFIYKKNVHKKLTKSMIKKIKPDKIFFIHWSEYISKDIFLNYDCIQFHCSDLPKFKGGSPIQNQILKGLKKTKLTAFKVTEKIDSGPIYIKKNISLKNNIKIILSNLEKIALKMIVQIIKKKIKPKIQKGESSYCNRRIPKQSFLPKNLNNISKIYDYMRMLDAEGYPKSKIKFNNFNFEFYNIKKNKNKIYGYFEFK
jgi:methionyl-tRNA formyltransferase